MGGWRLPRGERRRGVAPQVGADAEGNGSRRPPHGCAKPDLPFRCVTRIYLSRGAVFSERVGMRTSWLPGNFGISEMDIPDEWWGLPLSAAGARLMGVKRFFTGHPCPHGHVAPRRVRDSKCFVCRAARECRRRAKFALAHPDRVRGGGTKDRERLWKARWRARRRGEKPPPL